MQYTRKDWVRAGLNTLAEEGVEAVRVEAIARKLSISKGSFYHHFADRQDLLNAMIDYWELHATERIISAPEAEQATLEQLLSFVFATERKTEAAMYAWAKQNPELGKRVAGIEKRRIGYVAALYAKKGLSPGEANARAHLAYLVYIGWLVRGELDEPFDIAAPLQHFLNWTT
ncbi:TetR/AcrR family transcriptional regulator [Brevibacillus parabrevis]|uniref:TetR/AcrR family transcriptional regulator n=1 Tax=Brevibacillus parabrevis TaxID=54914 RepID=UPI0028534E04|nr:TetR/AcrR family transcriptional regulator [Brevibacillus parabrevis]MDR4998960.1 TetR/AcrR family transcriptional regulator [Brevibacillus parabrevis]